MAAVSSEAMLGGQKSPYKLLVRAVNQHTGVEVPYITFVASEDFVVSHHWSSSLALLENPAPPPRQSVFARGGYCITLSSVSAR
jgi:hypothetical protein